MTDPATSPETVRNGELPSATLFDPATDPSPAVLARSAASILVLLLDMGADRGWTADSALAVAAARAQAGRRVVLADLHLEQPMLHERIGEPNLDGVTDIFLYGASLARSARPVPGRGFYLIPAGTYTPDVGAVYRHSRWSKLVAGFRDAEATLLLFLPGGAEDASALVEWIDEVVVLGEPADTGLLPVLRERGIPEMVLLPPGDSPASPDPEVTLEMGTAPPPVAEPDPIAEEADEGAEEADEGAEAIIPDTALDVAPADEIDEIDEIDEAGDPNHFEHIATPTAAEPEEDWPTTVAVPGVPILVDKSSVVTSVPDEQAGAGRRRRRERERRTSPFLWAGLGILLVGAAGYLLLARSSGAGEEEPTPLAVETASQPVPELLAAPLPYSVQIKAFAGLDRAREQIEIESQRFPDVPFYISPEPSQGVLYYKVRAGLVPDTVAAGRLQQRLVEGGAIEPEDTIGSWSLIQHAPLAFHLGEFTDSAAAALRADSLAASGIPSYAVALPYSDGSRRWRLYGGSFRDTLAAGAMQELLGQAGIQAALQPRLGPPPTTGG